MLHPLIAIVALTLGVSLVLLQRRILQFCSGEAKAQDYVYGGNSEAEGTAKLANRNLANLFEMPVLFYVLCLATMQTNVPTTLLLPLAWGYVTCRAAHTLIHLTYNNVMHRAMLYIISNAVLIALWVIFTIYTI